MITRRILPIPMGVLPNSYAVAINMSLDEDYILSAQLVDQNGNTMGTAQTVDLPLESVIVDGRYDDNTQSLILVLDNGNEITIPVSGLIAGLQEEITAQNPLSADLLTDGTNNKVFTAAEQTKLSGIETGAEVNVQANWNESDNTSDAYIQNKPTLGTMASGNQWFGSKEEFDAIPAAELDTNTDYYISDVPQSDWYETNPESESYIKNKPNFSIKNSDFANTADYQNKNQVNQIVNKAIKNAINDYDKKNRWITQSEYDTLVANNQLEDGVKYHIEGTQTSIEMVITFTDQSTATYNVYIE